MRSTGPSSRSVAEQGRGQPNGNEATRSTRHGALEASSAVASSLRMPVYMDDRRGSLESWIPSLSRRSVLVVSVSAACGSTGLYDGQVALCSWCTLLCFQGRGSFVPTAVLDAHRVANLGLATNNRIP